MDNSKNIRELFQLVMKGEPGYDEELHEAVDDYLEEKRLERAFEIPEDFTIHAFDVVDSADSEKLYEDETLRLTVDEIDEATQARTFRVWIK